MNRIIWGSVATLFGVGLGAAYSIGKSIGYKNGREFEKEIQAHKEREKQYDDWAKDLADSLSRMANDLPPIAGKKITCSPKNSKGREFIDKIFKDLEDCPDVNVNRK